MQLFGFTVAAMVCFSAFTEDRFLVLATRAGVVKKTMLSEYEGATREREGGLAAINLRDGDQRIASVLVGADGRLSHVWYKISPKDTPAKLLEALGR